MRSISITIGLLLFVNSIIVGQVETTEASVVKISTSLIQVDVSVTDKRGRVVPDLGPDDFEIYESGKRQSITSFSFVSGSLAAGGPAPSSPLPSLDPRREPVRRTFAIVADDLMLSFESAFQTRRAVRKIVDAQLKGGDLVAIIRTSEVGTVRQFTTDKQRLYAAIDEIKWNPRSSGGLSAFAPIEATPAEIRRSSGDKIVTDKDIEAEKRSARSDQEFRERAIAKSSLGAIRRIVREMRALPGRKSVILLSDGFPLLVRNEFGASDGGQILDFAQQVVDLANRASIVFYTVDARGLQTTALTARDKILNPTPQRLQAILSMRNAQLLDLQDGLVFLARETGGYAILNSNDLAGGVRKALDDQGYYLIGYEPDLETFDAEKRRYNKFEVRVRRSGLDVRYRSGFFNVADR